MRGSVQWLAIGSTLDWPSGKWGIYVLLLGLARLPLRPRERAPTAVDARSGHL